MLLHLVVLLAHYRMMRRKTRVAAEYQKYWDLKEPMVLENLHRQIFLGAIPQTILRNSLPYILTKLGAPHWNRTNASALRGARPATGLAVLRKTFRRTG